MKMNKMNEWMEMWTRTSLERPSQSGRFFHVEIHVESMEESDDKMRRTTSSPEPVTSAEVLFIISSFLLRRVPIGRFWYSQWSLLDEVSTSKPGTPGTRSTFPFFPATHWKTWLKIPPCFDGRRFCQTRFLANSTRPWSLQAQTIVHHMHTPEMQAGQSAWCSWWLGQTKAVSLLLHLLI